MSIVTAFDVVLPAGGVVLGLVGALYLPPHATAERITASDAHARIVRFSIAVAPGSAHRTAQQQPGQPGRAVESRRFAQITAAPPVAATIFVSIFRGASAPAA
jgi:hypothetical protein